MALRFMDGADHYAVGAVLQKWSSSAQNLSIQAGRRAGSSAFRLAASIAGHVAASLTKVLTAQSTWIVGWAVLINTRVGLNNGAYLMIFYDGGTSQMYLQVTSDGALRLMRGATQVAISANEILTTGVWHHIEMKLVIDNTSGICQVKLNGVLVLDFAGDTQNSANATADRFQMLTPDINNAYIQFDDLYVLDGTGPAPYNDFLGDLRIDTIYPTAEGGVIEWTPSAGTDNALLVDEAGAINSDTDYVSSSTAGQRDTYVTQNIPAGALNVRGVGVWIDARKDDAGARSIAPVIRQGGVNFDGTAQSILDTYFMYGQIYTASPDDAGAWSVADVNNAEFGVKLDA